MTKHKPELPKHRHRNWFKGLHNWVGGWLHTYHPFYDEHADYNTNAKSYYDYLARHSKALAVMTGFINRLLDRNIEFHETDTVTFTKKGDWIDNGECEPDHYDDVIDITADVKISEETKDYTLVHFLGRFEKIRNSIEIFKDGLYSPDYFPLLNAIDETLENHDNRLTIIENNLNSLINGLMGVNLKRLKKGIDYEIEFLNGFSTNSDDLIVEVNEFSDFLQFHVKTDSSVGSILRNQNITENTVISHTASDQYNEKSILFKIKLIGDYKEYSNTPVSYSESGHSIFNLHPVETRSSWNAVISTFNKDGYFEHSWRSYGDGYNSQLDIYNRQLIMASGNINNVFTIFKKKEND